MHIRSTIASARNGAVALLIATSAAHGQSPVPDPHWGANIYPLSTPELRAGVYFNRFTEFNNDGERFNDIDETAGLNIFMVSYTERSR